jgi:hypothetical protein
MHHMLRRQGHYRGMTPWNWTLFLVRSFPLNFRVYACLRASRGVVLGRFVSHTKSNKSCLTLWSAPTRTQVGATFYIQRTFSAFTAVRDRTLDWTRTSDRSTNLTRAFHYNSTWEGIRTLINPITLTLFRRKAGYSGMSCANCGKETNNPRFCSSKCSSSYNNRLYPRKVKTKTCKNCGDLILAGRTYCSDCWSIDPASSKRLNKQANSNEGSNAEVRHFARRDYRNSGRPLSCALCGYSLHVDVCHIKDIRSYPQGTPYYVINAEPNLIALCKNHHWEFDYDVL